jgi:hypothetical protein
MNNEHHLKAVKTGCTYAKIHSEVFDFGFHCLSWWLLGIIVEVGVCATTYRNPRHHFSILVIRGFPSYGQIIL